MLNNLKNIVGVIFSPSKTFQSIKERPNILTPFVVIVVGMVAITIILSYRFSELIKITLPGNMESSVTKIFTGIGLVILVIGLGISWMFKTLLLWLTSQLFNAKVSFKHILSLVSYSSMILFLKNILELVLIFITKFDKIKSWSDIQFAFGLDMFISPQNTNPFLYALLSKINMFSIWFLIILIIGTSIICEFRKTKASLVAGFVWFFCLLIEVCFAYLRGQYVGLK